MKKITLLLLLLIFTLLGCKPKIKLEVNECAGGIYPKESSSNPNNHKNIYDVLGDSGCYLFKEYNDFNDFLNENNLLMKKEIESKYSKDFFEDKSLIIYFGIDSTSGFKYKFNLQIEENLLRLKINKSRDRKKFYETWEVSRMFFIDINKEEIINTTEFMFSIDIIK